MRADQKATIDLMRQVASLAPNRKLTARNEVDLIAKAIDPAAFVGMCLDGDGNNVTATRRVAARAAARRVVAVIA